MAEGNGRLWDGADYAKNSQAQKAFGATYLPRLGLKGGEAVLDIGCGDGALTALIAASVPRGETVGTDFSESMIRTAESVYGGQASNLSFRLLDALALDYRERFDLVFSASALHWIKDHGRVLRGMHAALRPGGRLFLLFGAKGTASGVLAVIGRMIAEPRWAPHFGNFEIPFGFHDAGEYADLLAAAGFRPRRIETLPRDMVHPGSTGLEGWLRTTWAAYIHRVPENERRDFLGELLSGYLEAHPLDSAGNAHVSMVSLLVEADRV